MLLAHEYQEMRSVNSANLPAFFTSCRFGQYSILLKRFKNPKTLKSGEKDYEASTVKVSTNAVS